MSKQYLVYPKTGKRTQEMTESTRMLTSRPIGKVFRGHKMTRSKQPRRVPVYSKLWVTDFY